MRAFIFSGLNSAVKSDDRAKYLALPQVQNNFFKAADIMRDEFGINVDFNKVAMLPAADLYSIKHINLVTTLIVSLQVGVARALIEKNILPEYLASVSLGDAARSVIAGVIEFKDIVRATNSYPEARRELDQLGESVALLTLSDDALTTSDFSFFSERSLGVSQLSPRLLNISGTFADVSALREYGKDKRWRIVHLLNFPVHSKAFSPYSQLMNQLLATLTFNDAQIPIFSSTLLRPLQLGSEIKSEQTMIFENPHHWMRSVQMMTEQHGIRKFINIGPCKTLAKSARLIDPSIEILDAAEFF